MTGWHDDPFHRRARAEGFRARSAYKLAELDERFGLFRPGDYVVDLGAAPGAWLQVALARVGPKGRVVGVDLAPIEPLAAANVLLVQADVRDPSTAADVRDHLGRRADVLLSDLAPKLSGVRARDEARIEELVESIVELLHALLRPGGRFLGKLFRGPGYTTSVTRLRELFTELKTTRPEATRRGSAELYAIGSGYRGTPASRQ
jgi:23S rRNA (uridine2552-2'-O)-methyltransferase